MPQGTLNGVVPESLPGAERPGPIHQVLDDQVLIELPGVARVLVRAGAVAGVDPAPGVDPEDVSWLLDGHASQVAALQRGQLALRASAVTIDGRAVAICAPGAYGASAAAAGLARRGHQVLADGWLPVVGPELHAQAVTDELALWPDVAQMVDLDPDGGRPVRPGLAKRRHRFARGHTSPLAAIVVLQRYGWEGDINAEQVAGSSSLEQVLRFVALDHLITPMGLAHQRFLWAVALASERAVHRLELDPHRPGVAKPAEALERLVLR